jgi:hypothetical protein
MGVSLPAQSNHGAARCGRGYGMKVERTELEVQKEFDSVFGGECPASDFDVLLRERFTVPGFEGRFAGFESRSAHKSDSDFDSLLRGEIKVRKATYRHGEHSRAALLELIEEIMVEKGIGMNSARNSGRR